MSSAAGIAFLLLATLAVSPATGQWWWQGLIWSEQQPESCPSVNNETHVCRSLHSGNFTCVTIACCSYFEDHEDSVEYDGKFDDSDENDDEYNIYYAGSTDNCPVCYTAKNCSLYRCFDFCCSGFTRDMFGRCNNGSGEVQCENGGSLAHYHHHHHHQPYCNCPEGFSGIACEIPECECENGGECRAAHGQTYCDCPLGFSGSKCEIAECSQLACRNGGSCIRNGTQEYCNCPPDYVGTHCEKSFYQPAECPKPNSFDGVCGEQCTESNDCISGNVCCREGCATVCRRTAANHCTVENGRTLQIGDIHRPDSCTTCECMADGEVACSAMTCKAPKCDNFVDKPDQCCPVCEGTQTDREPIIRCPSDTIKVNVNAGSMWATINDRVSGIHAMDGQGVRLQVTYHPSLIPHCECKERWSKTASVQASAIDKYGQAVSCEFKVAVEDTQPPVFYNCPGDIFIFEDEIPQWEEPRFSDNVGVAEKSCSDRQKTYRPGNYPQIYRVFDFDRNVAECRFTIHVESRESTFESLPQGLRERSTGAPRANLPVILGSILGGLFLLAVISVLVFCCCRRRQHKAREQSHNHHGHHGIDNNIYHVPADVKLPPYSEKAPSVGQPPAYSTFGSMKGMEYMYHGNARFDNPGYSRAPSRAPTGAPSVVSDGRASVHSQRRADTASVRSGCTDHTYATLN
ncbi:neurogenic locus notch homolog protein 1-like [Mya arenaria]|uniref:neurogenic locus notch homolog protein 1-like n=1 Tax=Mya arenaria TaxID=6604 RepID=UPI0022E4C991|nr:neurogenic locus notch homolog protein 1-like [Mya arenaria]